jgi:cytochrome c biogenesis protein CcdA
MIETLTGLLPILLVDAVNPVLFGFMVVAAGTARPVLHSSMLLLGHTAAYFIAGILLAQGLDALTYRLENPKDIDFLVSLCVGLFCIAIVLPAKKNPAKKKTEEDVSDISPLSAFAWGAGVNFVGIPFALPYFAALSQILVADISSAEAIGALVGYNALYALPFAAVPVLVALSGDASRALLQRVNQFLDKVGGALMPLMLGGLGLFLVADAVIYFRGGTPLF